jgi:hypothetical protein
MDAPTALIVSETAILAGFLALCLFWPVDD